MAGSDGSVDYCECSFTYGEHRIDCGCVCPTCRQMIDELAADAAVQESADLVRREEESGEEQALPTKREETIE